MKLSNLIQTGFKGYILELYELSSRSQLARFPSGNPIQGSGPQGKKMLKKEKQSIEDATGCLKYVESCFKIMKVYK
jgi:hypothetical protein